MSFAAARSMVLSTNLAVYGVDVVLTLPAPYDDPSITTRGIWSTPSPDDVPASMDFQRREMRRLLLIPRAAVAAVPIGTRISAPLETADSPTQRWTVTGLDRQEVDHHRVIVVPDPDVEP